MTLWLWLLIKYEPVNISSVELVGVWDFCSSTVSSQFFDSSHGIKKNTETDLRLMLFILSVARCPERLLNVRVCPKTHWSVFKVICKTNSWCCCKKCLCVYLIFQVMMTFDDTFIKINELIQHIQLQYQLYMWSCASLRKNPMRLNSSTQPTSTIMATAFRLFGWAFTLVPNLVLRILLDLSGKALISFSLDVGRCPSGWSSSSTLCLFLPHTSITFFLTAVLLWPIAAHCHSVC